MSNKLIIKIKEDTDNIYSVNLPDDFEIVWRLEVNANAATCGLTLRGKENPVYYLINRLIIENTLNTLDIIDEIILELSGKSYSIPGEKIISIISTDSSISSIETQIGLKNLDLKDSLPFIG